MKVHDCANQLLDIAETGDREAYRKALEDMRYTQHPATYERAKEMAAQQYQMYQRYYRLHGWRSKWIQKRKQSV